MGNQAVGRSAHVYHSAREEALELLIWMRWLIAEAVERGLAPSDATIGQRLRERIEAVPNGEVEYQKEISSLGRTSADVKLEIDAELAAEKLSQLVAESVPRVTLADVANYYKSHRDEFRIPELRVTDLIEEIPTRARALALAGRVGPGSRFARMALRERVQAETPYEEAHRENGPLVHTIFAAKPGTIAGPVRFHRGWSLVVVRRVLRSHLRPLATVEEALTARLLRKRHETARQRFIEAYRRRWIAETDCSPGFVVQKCSQYHGRLAPEPDPLSFRAY